MIKFLPSMCNDLILFWNINTLPVGLSLCIPVEVIISTKTSWEFKGLTDISPAQDVYLIYQLRNLCLSLVFIEVQEILLKWIQHSWSGAEIVWEGQMTSALFKFKWYNWIVCVCVWEGLCKMWHAFKGNRKVSH